jgi:hypothetical protein
MAAAPLDRGLLCERPASYSARRGWAKYPATGQAHLATRILATTILATPPPVEHTLHKHLELHIQGSPMIRVFSHYLCRQSMLRVAFDLGFALLCMFGVFVAFADRLGAIVPHAAPPMLSVAAGLFVANTGAGFYQRHNHFTVYQALARAALALLVILPLTYVVFGMLPADLANRAAIQYAAMFGVGAVVLRRLYVTLWGADPLSRTRILIFGAGPAAQIVGATLKTSDPHAHIVGYLSPARTRRTWPSRPTNCCPPADSR